MYVGGDPSVPFDTATPETVASWPGTVQPVFVWVDTAAVALCELWQSAQTLCRFETPPNSLSVESVCVFGATGALTASWR